MTSSIFPNAETKAFVNSRLCPLHKCGLEGTSRKIGGREIWDLECVFDPNHYRSFVSWNDWEPYIPQIDSERLWVVDGSWKYGITIHYKDNLPNETNIHSAPIDGNGDIIEGAKWGKVIDIDDGDIFDFRNYDEAVFVKKIRL